MRWKLFFHFVPFRKNHALGVQNNGTLSHFHSHHLIDNVVYQDGILGIQETTYNHPGFKTMSTYYEGRNVLRRCFHPDTIISQLFVAPRVVLTTNIHGKNTMLSLLDTPQTLPDIPNSLNMTRGDFITSTASNADKSTTCFITFFNELYIIHVPSRLCVHVGNLANQTLYTYASHVRSYQESNGPLLILVRFRTGEVFKYKVILTHTKAMLVESTRLHVPDPENVDDFDCINYNIWVRLVGLTCILGSLRTEKEGVLETIHLKDKGFDTIVSVKNKKMILNRSTSELKDLFRS